MTSNSNNAAAQGVYDMVKLRDEIIKEAAALNRWTCIVDHIVRAQDSALLIKKLCKDSDYAEAVIKTLHIWQSQGQARGDLGSILRSYDLGELADKLRIDSAPGACDSGKKEEKVIEINISARGLKKMDWFSESDPVCVVFRQEYVAGQSTAAWEKIFNTETKTNNPNPDFITKLVMAYRHEDPEKCWLRFELIDSDDTGLLVTEWKSQDFLGFVECTLADIIEKSMEGSGLRLPLSGDKGKGQLQKAYDVTSTACKGWGHIVLKSSQGLVDAFTLQVQGHNMGDSGTLFSRIMATAQGLRRGLFFVFSRQLSPDSDYERVYESEALGGKDPVFPCFTFTLCDGNRNAGLKLEFFKRKMTGDTVSSSRSLGYYLTTVNQLYEFPNREPLLLIQDGRDVSSHDDENGVGDADDAPEGASGFILLDFKSRRALTRITSELQETLSMSRSTDEVEKNGMKQVSASYRKKILNKVPKLPKLGFSKKLSTTITENQAPARVTNTGDLEQSTEGEAA